MCFRDDSKSLLPPINVGPREDDFETRLQEELISDQNGGLNKSPEKDPVVNEKTSNTEQSENEPKKETKLEAKNKKNIGSFFSGMFGKKPLVCSGGLSHTNSTLDVSERAADGNPLVVAANVGSEQQTPKRNGDDVSESPEHAADGDESNASASITAASENNSSEEVPESDDTTINDNSASTTESEKKPAAKKVSFFRQFSKDISEATTTAKDCGKEERSGGAGLRSFFGKKKTTAKLELEESEESLPVSEEEDEGNPEVIEEEQRPEIDGDPSKGLDMSGR
jgi:hypothetical protein